MNSVSRVLSLLFHPVLMPLAGICLLLFGTNSMEVYPLVVKQFIVYTVTIGGVVLPFLFIPFYRWMGVIESVYMHHNRERVLPMFITAGFYYFTLQALQWMFNSNPGLSDSIVAQSTAHFLLATTVTAFAAGLISYWWKISIHMVAMGGILGLLGALIARYGFDRLILLLITLLVSGLVGASRLEQKSHTPAQLYIGYALGSLVMYLSISIPAYWQI